MLSWLRAALTLTTLCLSIFLGAIFASQNTGLIPLVLFTVTLPEQSVAVWLLGFLILGVVVGSLISSTLVMTQRASLMSLRRENSNLRQRLDKDVSNG